MNKTLVTLILIIIALGSGVVYLHIHNNNNDLPKPPLANEVSDVERVRDIVSEETPNENMGERVMLEDGIALTDTGFVPNEIETGDESIVIYNQTDATVLIAQQGVDCAVSPAECDLVAPGESLELNRAEAITYITNDGHSLVIATEE